MPNTPTATHWAMLARNNRAVANQHCRNMDLQSRVASASPHGLVSLLYEELLRSLSLLVLTVGRAARVSGNAHNTTALLIIIALESSIDFDSKGIWQAYCNAYTDLLQAL